MTPGGPQCLLPVPVGTYIKSQRLIKIPGMAVNQTWVPIPASSGKCPQMQDRVGGTLSLTDLRLVYQWDVGPRGVLFSKHFTSPNSY